jgi:hypothetical protein
MHRQCCHAARAWQISEGNSRNYSDYSTALKAGLILPDFVDTLEGGLDFPRDHGYFRAMI